jgi:hypothetical protein
MRHTPERLAWTVLLISFAVCVTLAISGPLLIYRWVDTAYVELHIKASSVQRGTLQIKCGDNSIPVAITEPGNSVCQGTEGITILTGDSDQGTLIISAPDTPQLLAELHIDSNSQLRIGYARTPRFSFSAQPHTLFLSIESGRIRLSTGGAPRPVAAQINTPEAWVQMTQGSVSIQAGVRETRVRLHDGTALVVWASKGEGIHLGRFESLVIPPPGDVLQALPRAQDWVTNGDFSLPLDSAWQPYSKDIEFEGEPPGQVVINALQAASFVRVGKGHAETGIAQALNRDVRSVQSLQVRMTLRVLEQNVPVCGTRGTECPIMVKIDYQDMEGELRSWLQGFYTSPDPNRANPPFCTVCNPRADHLRVQPGAWYVYDSPDLIPLLNQAGPAPARLVALTVYASGHTYRSEVSHIELLVQ